MQPVMLWQLAGLLGVAYLAYQVIKFIRADADLRLLSKSRPPAGAFKNKVIWIVGASQGLGEVLARYWADKGAKLILSSRSAEKLEAVKEACRQYIPADNIVLLPLDLVGPPSQLEAAAQQAFDAFDGQGVDYVIHNAGASQHAAADQTSPEVAAALIKLNLQGPINLCRATLPAMIQQQRGRHVIIASMAGVVPSAGQAVYSAAKTGLKAYFLSVASELADKGVGVTICCPGPVTASQGGEGRPRQVYGPAGIKEQVAVDKVKERVPVARAAELIATAAYHGLDEAWIALHPVLLMGYLTQFMPSTAMRILKRVGPGRVRAMRRGGSHYDLADMLKKE
ncbi:hypothetical protein N2152v2_001464 [Parachlorella kessleri]